MVTSAAAASQALEPAPIDLKAVKLRQHGAWSSGDYAIVGTTLQIVGEDLCEALDVRAGQSVLDVAAGNGNAALAAARRWCAVVATDYVPALLERARERAAAERLPSTSARLTRRRCRSRTLVRQCRIDFRRDVHTRPGSRGRRAGARVQARAGRSGWPIGRRRASSASCSRPSASMFRLLPAPGRLPSGARGRGSRSFSRRVPCRSGPPSATSCSATARRSIG